MLLLLRKGHVVHLVSDALQPVLHCLNLGNHVCKLVANDRLLHQWLAEGNALLGPLDALLDNKTARCSARNTRVRGGWDARLPAAHCMHSAAALRELQGHAAPLLTPQTINQRSWLKLCMMHLKPSCSLPSRFATGTYTQKHRCLNGTSHWANHAIGPVFDSSSELNGKKTTGAAP